TAPADDNLQSLDNKAAAAAHGPNQPAPITAPPAATIAQNAPAASGAFGFAGNADPNAGPAGAVDGLTAGKGRPSKEGESFGSTLAGDDSVATRGAVNKDKNDEE